MFAKEEEKCIQVSRKSEHRQDQKAGGKCGWYCRPQILSSYQLACVSIRANTKPKARRYARPKGGHYEGRGLWIRLYRYASQLVRRFLPD